MNGSKKRRLQWTAEAETLKNSLTMEEKIWLMSGNLTIREMKENFKDFNVGIYYQQNVFRAGGIPEKQVPSMRLCDGTRGVVGGKKSTCFPSTICRGATFNQELERKIGQAIAKEVLVDGGNLFAGICINLPYHPGWGRSQETYGEESFHIGEMGSALVEGVQKEGVIACIKHFAFNSMEFSRFKVSITCDIRTEREVFLPHFKKCIDHGAACVMSAYNAYQGSICGHNQYLLNEVLKSEWGFDGFVMSDFILGIRDTIAAADGGMDMEMCAVHWFGEKLLKAVNDGVVLKRKIDDSVLRILRTLLAFENINSSQIQESVIGCKKHILLATQAAREGITLIKNEGVLPLDRRNTRKILVLGRLAQAENVGDHGPSWVPAEYITTPLQGIANIAQNSEVLYYDGKNLRHAKDLAKKADAVIFVVGCDENSEGEYGDIAVFEEGVQNMKGCPGDRNVSLDLQEDELDLLKAVGPINKKSIVVLIGGGMIMIEEWKKSVNAILMAYYPGMEGGTAIAEVIFGKVNPSGKLPFVIPYSENDLPIINWETEEQFYDYYHGYAKIEKEGKSPSVPFGFGLSYTTFRLKNEKFEVRKNNIYASCEIENTGQCEGVEVVQMYIGFSNSKVDRPIKLLRGFKRIKVKENDKKEVKIHCSLDEIKWYNPQTRSMELEHMEYEIYIGTSSDNTNLLKGKITIQ